MLETYMDKNKGEKLDYNGLQKNVDGTLSNLCYTLFATCAARLKAVI